jgi:hypothetical protein
MLVPVMRRMVMKKAAVPHAHCSAPPLTQDPAIEREETESPTEREDVGPTALLTMRRVIA